LEANSGGAGPPKRVVPIQRLAAVPGEPNEIFELTYITMNETIYIVQAQWCEDTWAIAAGTDQDKVIAFAEAFMEKNKDGVKNRIWVDGYRIESVPSL
jgi:hypothetical protein